MSSVFPGFLVGAIGVSIRADLDFDDAHLGLTVGAFFASGAAGSVIAGRIGERLGASRALQLGLGATAVMDLAIAAFARSWALLTVGLALAGLANALNQPAANLLLTGHLPERRLGFGIAIKQSGMPASAMAAGLAVPALALTVGWRWAFVAGAVLVCCAQYLLFTLESADRPTQVAGRPDMAMRRLILLAAGIAAGAFAAGGLSSWLVSAAVDADIGEGMAGLLLTVGSAAGITSRLVLGHRADRTGLPPLRTAARMLAIGACAFPLLGTGLPVVIVLVTPVAFAAGWAWPGLFNFAVVRANPSAPAAATGVTQTGTYLGAMAGPVVTGFAVERWGYDTAWVIVAVAAALGAAILAFAHSRLADEASLKVSDV
jgi:MFS family permease